MMCLNSGDCNVIRDGLLPKQIWSWRLDLKVVGSDPPTAGQLPHLQPSVGCGSLHGK